MHEKPLSDIIKPRLIILFVGFNPGIESAATGHHYAHRSNRFWRLLYESGLTPDRWTAEEDRRLLELNFGSTNIVDRPSRSVSEISREELKNGAVSLNSLIKEIKPRIVCYVGIGVYKAYASQILGIPLSRLCVSAGLQTESIVEGVCDFVCSNPSGLNTIPIAEQRECFRKLRDLAARFSILQDHPNV